MRKLFLFSFLWLLLFTACNDEEKLQQESGMSLKKERTLLFGVKTLEAPTTRAAVQTFKKWENGETIKIKFLNGTAAQQNYVKQVAGEWLNYANLKFEYISSGTADVKIAFDWKNDYTTWSYVGTESRYIPQTMPSVNFGFLDEDVFDYEDTKAQVLQTFGRVLGLVYEHQSPVSTVKWKEPLLINYLRTMGWEEREINDFFIGLSSEESEHTAFDPNSIMVYSIPARYTEDGYGVNLNLKLSQTDIDFIKTIYPKNKADYYNGYEHDLSEPNWEKLKTINSMIGTTRDKDGNYYFYPYNSGNIVKYDESLTTRTTIATAIGNDFRNSPRIIPTNNGDLLTRKVYTGGGPYVPGLQCVNLTNPWGAEKSITDLPTYTYTSITYDYDREYLYHGYNVLNKETFNSVGTFQQADGTSGDILYWGDKYKWVRYAANLGSNPIFYVYQQSAASDLFSTSSLVAKVTVPGFTMSNGGLATVYEYNNKLVVVNFITQNILILSPDGKYNVYNYSHAKWTASTGSQHFCGGFFWKHKLLIYGQGYGKWYFEFPELMN